MRTILLVDDADTTRDAYATLLEWLGYRVILAGDGGEACAIAREQTPDCIVMDLNLPGIDGWEATQILKSDPATAHVPVLAITASMSALSDQERIMRCGFAAARLKPVTPTELLAEIHRWTEPEGAPPVRLEAGAAA
jgi:two-component system, cell cycle response regulator DivK